MDDVLEKFESTLISEQSVDQNKTIFDSLYKNWGKFGNQEERRKETLEVQKSNRNNKLDKFRGILEIVKAAEHDSIFRSCYRAYYRPTIYVAGFNRASSTYSNVLMMSEWLIEKPKDFNDNWYVIPCPKGLRMLVVANQGITRCYTKFGHFKLECRTALPGGNPGDTSRKQQCSVLDCFYEEKINTMYVLDLLAWKDQPMTDGETEFRHYWLESQMSEMPELKIISKMNKINFRLLPKIPCTRDSLNKFMMTYPHFESNLPALDGLLFYHKKAHYVSGETPLVGWLYPFMVPEILGTDITLSKVYLIQKPDDYVNQAVFIRKFQDKASKKYKKSTSYKTDTMESQIGKATSKPTNGESKSMEDEENDDDKNIMMAEDTSKHTKRKRGAQISSVPR